MMLYSVMLFHLGNFNVQVFSFDSSKHQLSQSTAGQSVFKWMPHSPMDGAIPLCRGGTGTAVNCNCQQSVAWILNSAAHRCRQIQGQQQTGLSRCRIFGRGRMYTCFTLLI